MGQPYQPNQPPPQSQQQYGVPPPQSQHGAPPPQMQNAPPPGAAGPTPLARLPLQIGTTATWSAARSALALFPGLAILGGAIAIPISANVVDGGTIFAALLVALPGGLLTVFAVMHLMSAIKTRASDLLLFPEGLQVDGGRLHGERIGWKELHPPYAEIEDTTVKRLTLWRIFLFLLSLMNKRSRVIVSPVVPVRVWRLHVFKNGQRTLIAETDRPIESDSMNAAKSSVCAVVEGQRYVEQAPAVPAQILSCASCGGPAVPDDAPSVTCNYCHQQVPMPQQLRAQAAGSKAMAQSRTTTTQMIAKLRDQPRAAHTNLWLLIFSAFMFGAWPIGWGVIAVRVLGDGFQPQDTLFLLLPLAAVLGGFFMARGRLADRGALQLLTLGFGALAPRKEGEPSRCRRCQGPLPTAGIGGVTHCAYCSAENIVGMDLRPSLDPARTEQVNFDDALKKRAKEKLLWTVLSVVAAVTLVGWIGGTIFYVASMVEDDTPVQGHAPTAKVTAPNSGDPSPSATATATTTAKPETKPKGVATTKPATTKPESKPEASTKPAASSSSAAPPHH
ncbi:MAG: hypothetical protein ABI183_20350 [Polyangiaceae bacterium]